MYDISFSTVIFKHTHMYIHMHLNIKFLTYLSYENLPPNKTEMQKLKINNYHHYLTQIKERYRLQKKKIINI